MSARKASITCVIGWFSANNFNAQGMPAVGTKALEANVSGKIITNPIHCTASIERAKSPMTAASHENANVNNITRQLIKSQSVNVASGLKPTKSATKIMMTEETIFRTKSAVTCPNNTAPLNIGSDLNLSTMPRWRSVATERDVVSEPKAAICTKIPATKKFTYVVPPVSIAPPNTYRNRSMNIIGCRVSPRS